MKQNKGYATLLIVLYMCNMCFVLQPKNLLCLSITEIIFFYLSDIGYDIVCF